jgi:hypothetical protein
VVESNVVVLFGTGAFATVFGAALAEHTTTPLRLVVVGRDEHKAGRVMADLPPNRYVVAQAVALSVPSVAAIAELMRSLTPRLVVVCASPQSPYRPEQYGQAWRRLLAETAFGVTAPLQAMLAVPVAEAIRAVGIPETRLVNACYPDLVNPLLTALGYPVLCGLGNVASLAAGIPPVAGPTVRVLAHHRHLKRLPDGEAEARVWVGDQPWPHGVRHIRRLRTLPRRVLNALGAGDGGRLAARLLAGADVATSLPGVAGMGGYPVRVTLDGCRLDLPADLDLAAARMWQADHARHEGVLVQAGQLRFCGATAQRLRALEVIEQDAVPVARWRDIATRLMRLRSAFDVPRGNEALGAS